MWLAICSRKLMVPCSSLVTTYVQRSGEVFAAVARLMSKFHVAGGRGSILVRRRTKIIFNDFYFFNDDSYYYYYYLFSLLLLLFFSNETLDACVFSFTLFYLFGPRLPWNLMEFVFISCYLYVV